LIELGDDILAASFTCRGVLVFLVHDKKAGLYRLATRWNWLADYDCYLEACGHFEKLKVLVWDATVPTHLLKLESSRAPC